MSAAPNSTSFSGWQTLYGIPAYGMIYDRRYPMNPIISKGSISLRPGPGQRATNHQFLGLASCQLQRRTRH